MGSQPMALEPEATSDLAVLVGPARFPRFLERPQVTRRLEGGEIVIDEFTRWAGGFEENVIRALAQDLAARLGSERVVGYPSSPPFALDYKIRIHFDEFVSGPDDALHVRVRWAIARRDRAAAPSIARADLDLPLADNSMLSLVSAHDEAIRLVGSSMAAQIERLESESSP
jgi:uncharacterized lipoprotein YmbA